MKRKITLFFLMMLIALTSLGGTAQANDSKAKRLPYWLEIDLTHNLVIAYSTSDNAAVRTMLCSPGEETGWTPTGTFYMPERTKSEERGPWYKMSGSYVRYATRIYKGIMTHSILYRRPDVTTLYVDTWKNLGKNLSHGCLRMTPLDAQWVAFNCDPGTKVIIRRRKKSEERKRIHEEIVASLTKPENGMLGQWEATLSPTPAPLMVQGGSGYYVDNLQLRLASLGFYGGKINGQYDEDTTLAIMNFQEAMGVGVTGIADDETQSLIYSSDAAVGAYVTVHEGDTGPVVKMLQTKLAELGYYNGKINSNCESATINAAKRYCEAQGLTVDNLVLPSVLARLFGGAYARFETEEISDDENYDGSGAIDVDTAFDDPTTGAVTTSSQASGGDQEMSAEPTPTPIPRPTLAPGSQARIQLDKEGSSLKQRATESTESEVLQKIPHQAVVQIVELGEKYHKVVYGGVEGYVSAKYVKMIE